MRVNGICVNTCKYTKLTQNTIIPFMSKLFFLDPAQRNHGRLDKDGRSCAMRHAQHGPFVSTTMQVQEVGDATKNKKDK